MQLCCGSLVRQRNRHKVCVVKHLAADDTVYQELCPHSGAADGLLAAGLDCYGFTPAVVECHLLLLLVLTRPCISSKQQRESQVQHYLIFLHLIDGNSTAGGARSKQITAGCNTMPFQHACRVWYLRGRVFLPVCGFLGGRGALHMSRGGPESTTTGTMYCNNRTGSGCVCADERVLVPIPYRRIDAIHALPHPLV